MACLLHLNKQQLQMQLCKGCSLFSVGSSAHNADPTTHLASPSGSSIYGDLVQACGSIHSPESFYMHALLHGADLTCLPFKEPMFGGGAAAVMLRSQA